MVSDRRGKGWTSGQNDGSNAVPWRRFLERSRQATIAPSRRDVSQRAMRKGGTTKKFANQFRKHHAYLRTWPWSNSLDAVTQRNRSNCFASIRRRPAPSRYRETFLQYERLTSL
jgi:hypothetical protein